MKNKINVILILLAGMFILNSCLKDDEHDYWKDSVDGKMYATIAKPGFQSQSLLPIPDEVPVKFLVNIATDKLPTRDITLTLDFDNLAISAYDSTLKAAAIANGDTTATGELIWKDYKPWPSVQLITPTITIPAGSRNAYAEIRVARADTVKLTGNYMTALTITDADGVPIAANMKTVLWAFPLANEYEGDYSSEGFRDHPTAGIQPFLFAKVKFSTVNATTVHKAQVGNYAGYGLDITVTTDPITVNGAPCWKCTLKVTKETDDPGTDWGAYETFEGQPTNYYNPATSTFDLYYWYSGAAPRKLREINTKL